MWMKWAVKWSDQIRYFSRVIRGLDVDGGSVMCIAGSSLEEGRKYSLRVDDQSSNRIMN